MAATYATATTVLGETRRTDFNFHAPPRIVVRIEIARVDEAGGAASKLQNARAVGLLSERQRRRWSRVILDR